MTKKDRIQAARLKGFRDYLPQLMAARLEIMDTIRREAALAGFQTIGTPALEYATTLLGQGGDETDKQVYRFTDHGDRDVALRFDLTVPFARFVAEHQNELSFPFKKLQIGDVWRGENTQKGRYREFCQCDLDIIGADSAAADIEILATFQRILASVPCGQFTQAVGQRRLLSALIRKLLGGLGEEAETPALIAIDKLAKIGPDNVHKLLAAIPGSDSGGARALLELLVSKDAQGDTDMHIVAGELAGDESSERELKRLQVVLDAVRASTVGSNGQVRLDLSVARGLGYYTGIVFETTLAGAPGIGSISSGGRYNDLAGRFTSRELPGVGGSIGLDRLLTALEEMGQVTSSVAKPIFVAVATDDALGYACELVQSLRRANLAADIGMVPKLGNQFKHADRLGCPFVVTVGGSEAAARTYAIKDMQTGHEERDLPAAGLVARLRS